MPRDFKRTDRVADFLRRELARQIQFEVKDPRLGFININDVEVSKDLSHAKIYFTVVGAKAEAEGHQAAEVLNKAAGFLRRQLAADNTMRTTPQLHFYYDRSSIAGGQLASLIDKAVAIDKQRQDSTDEH